MKTNAFILFFFALIIGCSMKSDPSPAIGAPCFLLTKSTLGQSSTTITYNSSNQPTSVVIAYTNMRPEIQIPILLQLTPVAEY